MFMQMFPGMGGQMGGYGYGFAQPQPQQSGPIFNANGYQIDPMTGAVVFGPDGQPMTQAKYNEMVQQQSQPAAPAAAPTMGMAPPVYAAGPTMNYQAPVASGTFPGGSPVGIVTPEPDSRGHFGLQELITQKHRNRGKGKTLAHFYF